jgi:hypothetical protein
VWFVTVSVLLSDEYLTVAITPAFSYEYSPGLTGVVGVTELGVLEDVDGFEPPLLGG